MDSLPKISIVTPNYNLGQFLERTILSVLGQGYPNLEYIIIDGGSTDNSVEIIKKYESQLTYWESNPDNGMYDAIQKGFERSTGDIMAYINSDDLYHEGAFYSVANIFTKHQKIKWLTGIPTFFNEQDAIVNIGKLKRWSKFNYLLLDYKWIQQESTFWHRELWENAGATLNSDLKLAGDLELWIRFFKLEKLYSVNTILAGFRHRKNEQLSSTNMEDYLNEANRLLMEYRNDISNSDRKTLRKIILINKLNQLLFGKFLSNRLSRVKEQLLDYPKAVYFNFNTNSF